MDIERIEMLAISIKLEMDSLRRRVQGKPGHQGLSPREIVMAARKNLDRIEKEILA